MEWLMRWRQYEAKVWRHAWGRTEAAAKKVVSTGLGITVSATLGLVLLGAAVELKSFLPLLVALVLFLATLWVNLFLAPSQLDHEAQTELAGANSKVAELQDSLKRKTVHREQYEALKLLLEEGQDLTIRGGMPTWDDWALRVTNWRERVYDLLPVERDGFWSTATPTMFAAMRDGQHKIALLASQLDKFRRIMMRLENELDDWEPSKR